MTSPGKVLAKLSAVFFAANGDVVLKRVDEARLHVMNGGCLDASPHFYQHLDFVPSLEQRANQFHCLFRNGRNRTTEPEAVRNGGLP